MRKALTIVGCLVVLAIAGGLFLTGGIVTFLNWAKEKAAEAKSRGTEEVQKLKEENLEGFTPARSPDEALEKFREACQKRNYKAASKYCGGKYYEYIDRGAEPASDLGQAIDDLREGMNKRDINSRRTKNILKLLDPFPGNFSFERVVQKGGKEDEAVYVLKETDPLPNRGIPAITELRQGQWIKNETIFRSLSAQFLPLSTVVVKREGEGKDAVWKIHFPMAQPQAISAGAETLVNKHKNYAGILRSVERDIRSKALLSADEVEGALKSKLAGAEE